MFKLLYDPFKIRIAYLLLEPFIFTYGAGKGVGCHAHGNGSFEVFFFCTVVVSKHYRSGITGPRSQRHQNELCKCPLSLTCSQMWPSKSK